MEARVKERSPFKEGLRSPKVLEIQNRGWLPDPSGMHQRGWMMEGKGGQIDDGGGTSADPPFRILKFARSSLLAQFSGGKGNAQCAETTKLKA